MPAGAVQPVLSLRMTRSGRLYRRLREAAFAIMMMAMFEAQERVTVSVTNVDVAVRDSSGAPVDDLTIDDFEVLEDGRPVVITNFSQPLVEVRSETKISQGEATPAPAPAVSGHVLIVIDLLSSGQFRRGKAIDSVAALVKKTSKGTIQWSVVSVGSRLRVGVPFTTDQAAVLSALDSIRRARPSDFFRSEVRSTPSISTRAISDDVPQAPFPEEPSGLLGSLSADEFCRQLTGQQEFFSLNGSLAAIGSAIDGLAGAPGRKSVLVVSSRLAVRRKQRSDRWDYDTERRDKYLADMRDAVVRHANAANAGIFILNPEGLVVPGGGAAAAASSAIASGDDSAAFWVATLTGGEYYPGNFPARSIDRFERATRTWYSLGYRVDSPPDGKYHSIKVRVRRPGEFRLLYRHGYQQLSTRRQLELALRSLVGISNLRGDLASRIRFEILPNGGEEGARVRITCDFGETSFVGRAGALTMYVSVFNEQGFNLAFLERSVVVSRDRGVSCSSLVRLPPGKLRVAVVVYDPALDTYGLAVSDVALRAAGP